MMACKIVMKQYDEIKYFGDYWGLPIIAFDKIDGSNLRFEYSQKRGFYKFGTRRQMIDSSSEYGFAIDLFLNKYNEELTKIFKSKEYRNIQSFVCYAELYGTKSAFGKHDFGNDVFDIILFDIDQYKKGFVNPKQFINDFQNLGIPRVIYEGNLNREFVGTVKRNEYNLSEGVVCKGIIPNRKNNNMFYCKIKTIDWFERLRSKRPDLYVEELKQAIGLIQV
jgi:hypothetical protein